MLVNLKMYHRIFVSIHRGAEYNNPIPSEFMDSDVPKCGEPPEDLKAGTDLPNRAANSGVD